MLKGKTLGILLAGVAAYGLYRYSKMTAEQKKDLMKKGKDFMDKNLGDLGNMFNKRTADAEK
jgi:hypothetical protein